MAEIIWSYKAYEDFSSIIEFIAKDSEHYASLTAKKIWKETKRIEQNPMEARMVPEAGYHKILGSLFLDSTESFFKLKEIRPIC